MSDETAGGTPGEAAETAATETAAAAETAATETAATETAAAETAAADTAADTLMGKEKTEAEVKAAADAKAEAEKKTADAKAEAAKKSEKNDEGAPETYEEFTLPEGIEVNTEMMEQFQNVAREMNLTQEQAQQLVNLQTVNELARAEASVEAFENTLETWLNDSKGDKDFGGDDFDANVALASKAVDTFGTPELREQLDASGLGNHPEVIRLLWNVGKAISDGDIASGSGPKGGSKSAADLMFGG